MTLGAQITNSNSKFKAKFSEYDPQNSFCCKNNADSICCQASLRRFNSGDVVCCYKMKCLGTPCKECYDCKIK